MLNKSWSLCSLLVSLVLVLIIVLFFSRSNVIFRHIGVARDSWKGVKVLDLLIINVECRPSGKQHGFEPSIPRLQNHNWNRSPVRGKKVLGNAILGKNPLNGGTDCIVLKTPSLYSFLGKPYNLYNMNMSTCMNKKIIYIFRWICEKKYILIPVFLHMTWLFKKIFFTTIWKIWKKIYIYGFFKKFSFFFA